MFNQVWKKYLPVIVILIKKAVNQEQSFSMNQTDFEKAAGGKRIKFSFSHLQINNGMIQSVSSLTPLAREFASSLLDDERARSLIGDRNLEFSLSGSFELRIKDSACSAPALTED